MDLTGLFNKISNSTRSVFDWLHSLAPDARLSGPIAQDADKPAMEPQQAKNLLNDFITDNSRALPGEINQAYATLIKQRLQPATKADQKQTKEWIKNAITAFEDMPNKQDKQLLAAVYALGRGQVSFTSQQDPIDNRKAAGLIKHKSGDIYLYRGAKTNLQEVMLHEAWHYAARALCSRPDQGIHCVIPTQYGDNTALDKLRQATEQTKAQILAFQRALAGAIKTQDAGKLDELMQQIIAPDQSSIDMRVQIPYANNYKLNDNLKVTDKHIPGTLVGIDDFGRQGSMLTLRINTHDLKTFEQKAQVAANIATWLTLRLNAVQKMPNQKDYYSETLPTLLATGSSSTKHPQGLLGLLQGYATENLMPALLRELAQQGNGAKDEL